jgi:hypothetical protein
MLHPVGIGRTAPEFQSVRDLSSFAFAMICRTGILHALVFLRAVSALQQSPLEVGSGYVILVSSGAFVTQGFSSGIDARHRNRIELAFTGWNHLFPPRLWLALVAFSILVFLLGELGATTSKSVVRDATVDLLLMQVLHIGFVGEAGVGGHDRAGLIGDVAIHFLESFLLAHP